MAAPSVVDRLREERARRGETLPALARRIGVRQEHLQAIEDGRLGDLPSGIYGRAAVRSFAAAYGVDPAAALAECEPLLRPGEEVISGLARVRGLRPQKPEPVRQPAVFVADAFDRPSWRPLAAAALDACVIVSLLLAVVLSAAAALLVPIPALQHSSGALTLVGVVLGGGYFLCFGGLGGASLGERVMGLPAPDPEPPRLTLDAIAARAVRSASADIRCIQALGAWLGAVLSAYRSQAV